ncbi:MAG: hypothetical protein JOY60_10585 [Burkholderiaceae bacterium]|nr:hypothetical protein [Burkholderiaceae bacterium]
MAQFVHDDPIRRDMASALEAGARLGVWRIIERLHACESGHWYRVEHVLATDERALLLVYRRSEDAASILLRFAEELPGVAQAWKGRLGLALDSGVAPDGLPYVVMQSLPGRALIPALADLPLRQRMGYLSSLCKLLHELHEQGLLLFELDPSMLWITHEGQAALMAMGLVAQGDGRSRDETTITGGLRQARRSFCLASLPYRAPELGGGEMSDLAGEAYALGKLMLTLLGARVDSDASALMGRADVKSLSSWVALSRSERESLTAVAQKAGAATPQERYQTVDELSADLDAWLSGQLERAAAPADAPLVIPADMVHAVAGAHHRPWAAVMLMTLGALALVWWFFGAQIMGELQVGVLARL